MNLSFITFVSVITASLAVSLCSLSGLFALWLKPETLKRVVPYLVALAVGVLLGDAFIHLIPDAVNPRLGCRGLPDDIGRSVLLFCAGKNRSLAA